MDGLTWFIHTYMMANAIEVAFRSILHFFFQNLCIFPLKFIYQIGSSVRGNYYLYTICTFVSSFFFFLQKIKNYLLPHVPCVNVISSKAKLDVSSPLINSNRIWKGTTTLNYDEKTPIQFESYTNVFPRTETSQFHWFKRETWLPDISLYVRLVRITIR